MKYNRFEKYKALFYMDKLEMLAEDKICTPAQIVVYPSYICNYKCTHCIMQEERKIGSVLSEQTLNKLVDDVIRLDIKSVIFSGGGEPLTNKFTLSTLKTLYDKGINTSLNTNGFFLPEDVSYINNLRVSIDAGTRETYADIHGIDAFDKITEKLKKIKKQELGLAFLINQYNYKEILDFCEWAQNIDYDFIHIRPAWLDADYLEGGDELFSKLDMIMKIKDKVERDYKNVYFRVDKFDGYWNKKYYTSCKSTPLIAVLCADGKFAVCQDNFIKFGDYNNLTFEECWFSEDHQKALDSINIHKCPRCVNVGYNEIIENCIMEDSLKKFIL